VVDIFAVGDLIKRSGAFQEYLEVAVFLQHVLVSIPLSILIPRKVLDVSANNLKPFDSLKGYESMKQSLPYRLDSHPSLDDSNIPHTQHVHNSKPLDDDFLSSVHNTLDMSIHLVVLHSCLSL
jgi:hypothetical protein